MAKRAKTGKKDGPRERRERRFEPLPNTHPAVVYLIGGLGAVAMGAGAWEEFGSAMIRGGAEGAPEPLKLAQYILIAGVLLVGITLWLGTSGEPAVRVGDGGVAVEKGGVRRMPWYAIDHIVWTGGALSITGKDEAGTPLTVSASLAHHAQAAAWIVKEARERVPSVVDVPADATLPTPKADAGETLPLDPPQVVGKHCAASGRVIAYEPDARVCPRCERVFHKAHVPDACECGALGLVKSPGSPW